MVVTGDRDAFQLIDPDSRVRVMATGARHHRHQGLRPPGGHRPLRHPAGADPRLLRAQGRHVGQHPGRPGHRRQDGVASCCSSSATSRRVLGLVDEISGAKRKQNLTEHADDARISKQLATIQRDVPVDVDPVAEAARASPTARGCARSSASSSCAPRCAAWRRRSATTTRRRPRRRPSGRSPRACARARSPTSRTLRRRRRDRARRRAPEAAGGPAARRGDHVALRASRPARRCWSATCDAPEELVAALGDRPVVAHDAKALRRGPAQPRARHAARRLPARAGAARLPVPRDLRGARPDVRRRRPGRRRRGARRRRWRPGSASSSTTAA